LGDGPAPAGGIADNQVVATTFSIPEGPSIELELAPRLESWNRYDDPDQVALREFLAHVRERIEPFLPATSDSLAFRLDIGLPDHVDPLWERDLDNYLFPIARELPRHVVSVWGTKSRAPRSLVRLELAEPADPGRDWHRFPVPRSLGSERAWKLAVHKATEIAAELPEGPVALQLAFTVGPGRRWPSMWKSSIDALDPLLGRTYPDRDWNPQDGRIVRLGLHQAVDPHFGNDVAMTVYARAADESWPELAWLAAMDPVQREAFGAQYRGKLRTAAERQAALAELAGEAVLQPRPARDPDSRLGVSEFRNDDDGYLAWIAGHQDGYVINILSGLNPSAARVHRARHAPRGGPGTGPYIKVCADELEELDRWAARYADEAIARCRICLPTDVRDDDKLGPTDARCGRP
jgi:hypothetical protein